ncbi:hypothetical protein ACN38_g12083 [Penicillium nordicum]|uniref:Uncharacterized protein n=1 Tax=Penicillium nordicum TaxID=229535 RepID=A0A0M9WA94_9EURO|nr:hypothetical protein ACN38_g12083 [Penicillium nordicum]
MWQNISLYHYILQRLSTWSSLLSAGIHSLFKPSQSVILFQYVILFATLHLAFGVVGAKPFTDVVYCQDMR